MNTKYRMRITKLVLAFYNLLAFGLTNSRFFPHQLKNFMENPTHRLKKKLLPMRHESLLLQIVRPQLTLTLHKKNVHRLMQQVNAQLSSIIHGP